MKAYSIEFRKKIVKAYSQGNTSIRKVAARFDVSKSFVQKLLEQQKLAGHLNPGKPGGGMNSELAQPSNELTLMVAKYPDATLSEFCEYWGKTYERWVSTSTMCRALQRHRLTLKKTLRSSQSLTKRVRELRLDYWHQIKNFEPNNLVFLDEMGVLLGLTRCCGSSPHGTRVSDFQPF